MPAIPIHHTGTSDAAWDGPAAEAKLRVGEESDYYRAAYAWRDPDLDHTTKQAYKFVHHEVSADGDIGAANIRACRTGIAALNGARGGTTIPEEDLPGVWRHLAAHLEDAGLEAAPLSRSVPSYPLEMPALELRSNGRVGVLALLEGRPGVPYGRWSQDLGYMERIAPGAVEENNADVKCYWNHDPSLVLGSREAGTLELEEREDGLHYRVAVPDTQYGRDLLTCIRLGNVRGSSFAFRVLEDEWEETPSGTVRIINRLELYEVGPVTDPAYLDTPIGLRARHRPGLVTRCVVGAIATEADHKPGLMELRRRLAIAKLTTCKSHKK